MALPHLVWRCPLEELWMIRSHNPRNLWGFEFESRPTWKRLLYGDE